MIRNILVCHDGSDYGDVACDYAIYLARELRARLIGLHVVDSRLLEGPLMSDISGWIGAQPYGAQVQQFRELLQEKGEAIVDGLARKASEQSVSIETWIKMGHPARVIVEEEAHAELVVMGQKGEHAEWEKEMTGSKVDRVVRQSIKPCLVTPEAFKPIHRILAAYDGSNHASQALTQAIELALALSVELVIVTVEEHNDRERADAIARDGMAQARAHECAAASMVVAGKAETEILAVARDQPCDLLVVGAYGHSRIRELILGSTTTHLITQSHKPVMLVR